MLRRHAIALIYATICALGTPEAVAEQRPTHVFAAASLKNALDEIGAAYTARTGRAVVGSYAASSALARQIEQGAPADLFVSADVDWMDYLAERGLIQPATRVDLLGNGLVLIAPRGSDVRVRLGPGLDLTGPLGDGRLAIGDPLAVPAGKYAKAALERLGAWPALADRLAPVENVRAALAMVAQGEAPLGIVYTTDAAVEPRVEIVATFPAATHPPIVYPLALTPTASADAAAFAAYLRSTAARALFEKHGFAVLAAPAAS
jgi:molybdate transport system substrate-binding protein